MQLGPSAFTHRWTVDEQLEEGGGGGGYQARHWSKMETLLMLPLHRGESIPGTTRRVETINLVDLQDGDKCLQIYSGTFPMDPRLHLLLPHNYRMQATWKEAPSRARNRFSQCGISRPRRPVDLVLWARIATPRRNTTKCWALLDSKKYRILLNRWRRSGIRSKGLGPGRSRLSQRSACEICWRGAIPLHPHEGSRSPTQERALTKWHRQSLCRLHRCGAGGTC